MEKGSASARLLLPPRAPSPRKQTPTMAPIPLPLSESDRGCSSSSWSPPSRLLLCQCHRCLPILKMRKPLLQQRPRPCQPCLHRSLRHVHRTRRRAHIHLVKIWSLLPYRNRNDPRRRNRQRHRPRSVPLASALELAPPSAFRPLHDPPARVLPYQHAPANRSSITGLPRTLPTRPSGTLFGILFPPAANAQATS